MTSTTLPDSGAREQPQHSDRKYDLGRDWSSWPTYDQVSAGLPDYWYPVQWSSEVTAKPQRIRLRGENIVIVLSLIHI